MIVKIEPKFTKRLNDKQIIQKLKKLPHITSDYLIVINDSDRSTPSSRIIELLRKSGIIKESVSFIIATGSHRPISIEKAIKLSNALENDEIIIHDCDEEENLVQLGISSRGTPVIISKTLKNAKKIITINSVEPHYFAGFTGGIKSIIPGLSGRKTIENNHKWAMDKHSRIILNQGNPLWEDLLDCGQKVPQFEEIISIQLINHQDNIYHLSVGSLMNAFEETKHIAKTIFCHEVSHKFDRIISYVESPLDYSLYQSQKAMENVKQALKEGGSFVLISQCKNGIGNNHFFKVISVAKYPDDLMSSFNISHYKLGDHKAYYWAKFTKKYELLYIGDLDDKLVNKLFMKKISQNWLKDLMSKWEKAGDKILIDKSGGFTSIHFKPKS